MHNIRRLLKSKDLIFAWTGRTIRGRYQQSVLGGLWILIQPIATVIMFTIIFTFFVPVDTGGYPYIVFSYVALIPWMLLANSLNDMTGSIVGNMSLVTKIYFPREILPISAFLARLLDFFIAFAIFVVLVIVYNLPIIPELTILLPLLFLIQILIIIGMGLTLAAVNVFYRDIQPLLALVIQLWFYGSPIIYPIDMVPVTYQSIYLLLNPMAGILEGYRSILLYGELPSVYLIFTLVESIIICFMGYWFFKRVEFQFADII